MEIQFIDVETICIVDTDVTIAGKILPDNQNTDQPTYTNIFCNKDQIINSLLEERSLIAKKVFDNLWKNETNEYGALQYRHAELKRKQDVETKNKI